MNYLIMLIGYAWPPGWWPQYGADAQHTRVQLMKGNMIGQPAIIGINLSSGTESEGPAIATISGVSHIFLEYDYGDPDGIIAIRYVGFYERAWSWDYANVPPQGSALAVWDVDNDGTVEVLHANQYTSEDIGAIFCRVGATGVLEWYGPYDQPDAATPTIYDLDGNGTMEIFFGCMTDDTLYCLNSNGTLRWKSPKPSGGGDMNYAPAVGQIIPGGDPEIVVQTGDYIAMYNARTGALLASRDMLSGTLCSAPAIADVDKDGVMEVFIYKDSSDVLGERLWCLKPSGSGFTPLWSKQVSCGGNVQKQGMGIADLNNDGWLDVVIGAGGTSDRVYCFRGYDGYQIWVSNQLAGDVHRGVAIADIDGDNRWEVIAQTIPGWIYCLAGENGAIQWQVELPSCTDAHDVSVGDTDNDGCSEIVVAGDGGSRLWVLDRSGTNCGSVDAEEAETGERAIKAWFSDGKICISSPRDGNAMIRIYDPVGRLVLSREMKLLRGENSLIVDLAPGIYIGIINAGKETARFRILLTK
ncbi:MAG: T9SS type A sorting domain-containing protein [candidate division WOR-3 bacterium]